VHMLPIYVIHQYPYVKQKLQHAIPNLSLNWTAKFEKVEVLTLKYEDMIHLAKVSLEDLNGISLGIQDLPKLDTYISYCRLT
jgi:hypothetical protein